MLDIDNKQLTGQKFIFLLSLCLACLLSFRVLADELRTQETTQQRIEEENRESLQPTETVPPEEESPQKAVLPHQAIDQEYLQRLEHQRQARKVDGVYVVMVLLGKQKDFASFPEQFSYLKQNGYFPQYETGSDLNEPLRKGELAFMLCKTLKIKGGVHLRLFGLSERYAFSELIFQGIMPYGNQQEIVTGPELISIFNQSVDYITGRFKP